METLIRSSHWLLKVCLGSISANLSQSGLAETKATMYSHHHPNEQGCSVNSTVNPCFLHFLETIDSQADVGVVVDLCVWKDFFFAKTKKNIHASEENRCPETQNLVPPSAPRRSSQTKSKMRREKTSTEMCGTFDALV